jgi:hypothetical protein
VPHDALHRVLRHTTRADPGGLWMAAAALMANAGRFGPWIRSPT